MLNQQAAQPYFGFMPQYYPMPTQQSPIAQPQQVTQPFTVVPYVNANQPVYQYNPNRVVYKFVPDQDAYADEGFVGPASEVNELPVMPEDYYEMESAPKKRRKNR